MQTRSKALTPKALQGVTPEQHRQAIDLLDQRWCAHAFNSLQRAEEALADGRSHDAKNYTWSAGVSTDKVFAIREIPSSVVSNIHTVRVDIGDVLSKLQVASKVLAAHQQKGYQPVTRLDRLDQKALPDGHAQ
jgi:hypothetical protein